MTEPSIGTVPHDASQRAACEAWIRQLATESIDVKNVQAVRRELGSSLATLVVTSAKLQAKARRKFTDPVHAEHNPPPVWWVSEKGLQQATAWQVARHKASWFPLGATRIDLCCGLGGDAIQLARGGRVVAVDLDCEVTELAEANLFSAGAKDFEVRCQEASQQDVSTSSLLHFDPDRRVANQRRSVPEYYQPPWDEVTRILRRSAGGAVKLAPAANIDVAPFEKWHRCWISLQRTVREQTLLVGELVPHGCLSHRSVSAIAIDAYGTPRIFASDPQQNELAPVVGKPLATVVDPDPAIRAAGLTEAFASRFGLHLLGGPAGFLTGAMSPSEMPEVTEMAVAGAVIWSGSCDLKKIRKTLRQHKAQVSTVKVRGSDHDPARVISKLGRYGDRQLTLWIARTDRVQAMLTEG